MKMKKYLALLLATIMTLCGTMNVFAAEGATEPEFEPRVISQTEYWTSPTTRVIKTVTDLGNGFSTSERRVTEYPGGVLTRATEGTAEESVETDIIHEKLIITHIDLWASFDWDSETVTVKSSHVTGGDVIKSTGWTRQKFETSKSNSSLLSLNKAYVKVDYKYRSPEGTNAAISGKVEVRCSVNGATGVTA